jgi:hypothetical protein
MQLLQKLAWATLLAFFSVAIAHAEVPRADARALMERSGMVAQLADEADQIRDSFPKQIEGEFPPDIVKPLTEVVVTAWDGQRLLDAVEKAYADALTPDDLKAANAFIDSPLGQRVVKAETEGESAEAWNEIETKRAELVAGLEADKERLAIVQRMDKVLRATDVSATIMLSLVRATVIAGAGDADPEMLATLEQMFELMRPQMLEENRTYVLASFARIYRDFSPKELGAYADYLETDTARTINGLFFAVADEHYTEVGEKIGEGMGALLRQKRS